MVVNKRHRSQSSITPAPTCRRENLVTMSERILRMRQELYLALKASGVHWDHMLKQRGMFSYTGLTGLVTCSTVDKQVVLLFSVQWHRSST